ncbi:MAG: hypothetical protein ACK56I_07250 [bacterium]
MTAKVARDPGAGDAADQCGDLLDHHHQRKTQNKGPGQAVAKLRTYLAVGANAAGVIVRCAGDQSRPQLREEPAQA